jgi:tRNA modification GTPase
LRADTIVALASGAGRAGVAVVRLSGPQAAAALTALTDQPAPEPRRAALRRFHHPTTGELLDQGLALFFAAPASFTGEDVVELHIHGGAAVIAAVFDALVTVPGVRPAEPGEFTRRAFENGKLDLTAAEGLADLVDAETEGQRRQALRQMQGALAALYEGWRASLLEAIALVEAEIDFPDEDLPDGLATRASPIIDTLRADIASHLSDSGRGERVRDGFRIAILGAPNAGKSSLLNALARREAAIVSDIPGTTRDVVEIRLVLAGFPVWVADTAGLRETADAVEAEGVRRALARAEEADLVLWAVDAAEDAGGQGLFAAAPIGAILVHTKADLHPTLITPPGGFAVSSTTGEGLAALEAELEARVAAALSQQEAPALTRARHRRLLEACAEELEQAVRAPAPELAGERLRRAADALGRLTGRIDVEEVLGAIFSSFCIGK